jgi:hypothetical protein
MKKNISGIKVTRDQLGAISYGAVIYSAGRRTYMPSSTQEFVLANSDDIVDPWRAKIVAYIEEKIASCWEKRMAYEAVVREAVANATGDTEFEQRNSIYNAISATYPYGYDSALGSDYDEDGWFRFVRKFEMAPPKGGYMDIYAVSEDKVDVVGSDDDFWLLAVCALRYDTSSAEGKRALEPDGWCRLIEDHADSIPAKWVDNFKRDFTEPVVPILAPDFAEWGCLMELLDKIAAAHAIV